MKTTKVIILFLLAIIPVLVLASQTVTVSTQDTVALPNSTNLLIPLNMQNNDSASIIEFTVNYPSFALFKGALPSPRMMNATVEYNVLNSTSSRVAALTEINITAGSGAVMYLVFDINASATAGSYSIDTANLSVTNIDLGTLPSSTAGSLLYIL